MLITRYTLSQIRTLAILSVGAVVLSACSPEPAVVNYEQVGACTGLGNLQGAGNNLAFLFFRIQNIDASKTNVDFAFKPKNLWLNTGDLYSEYNFIATGQYGGALGLPTMPSTLNVTKNSTVNVNKYVVFLVETDSIDGAKDANNTSYFLLYHAENGEPGKILARTNATKTSWPYTPRCQDINFPK
jgi:hypothetical protein